MEEKQLNFNAPLLSVRRSSSTLAFSEGENGAIIENSLPNRQNSLPFYKSDLNLDQVTKPVAVPFLWEHIPGTSKSGIGAWSRLPEEPSDSPRLPPGRVGNVIQQPSKKGFQVQNVFGPQREATLSTNHLTKLESSKEGINEKGSSDSENDDDAYSDALDTLSPTESFSPNCSVSGLSGSDGPDVKPSGTFSTDPQTQDFMMSRFLPAAKAMALEPPHYVFRKQPVALEQPRQINKVVSGDRGPALNRYGSIVPYYGLDEEEEESEYEDDDHDDSGNISAKACGFLPRFCLKNSLCLLNPVPGMKVRTQAPRSSSSGVRRLAKTAYSGSQSQTVNKHAWDVVVKQKLASKVQSPEHHEVKNKWTGESNQVMYSSDLQRTRGSDLQRTRGSSPYRRSGGGHISPYRNEASHSPFHEGMSFLGVPKEAENFKANSFPLYNKGCDDFREVLSHQANEAGSGSGSPTAEKTLYIDSISSVENSHLNPCYSDTKGQMDSAGDNFETLVESRMEEIAIPESSFQDIRCLNIFEGEGILKPKVSGPVDAYVPSYPDISHFRGQANSMEAFQLDRVDQESRSLECVKVPIDGNLDFNNEQNLKAHDPKISDVISLQSALPPPLPKSPSESWLWRTLPSVSSRNLFSHSRKLAPQTSSTGTKWETIVKTSKLNYDHVRYSEELITHVPNQSKT
ncbi:hypothetical protein L1049_009647 [Liquidambar formosana]|uniref:Uncharacterized protein n=1 Tax=Liquidambar formosana TaxID=63359 RepID=A0AAP0R3L1_LIQFO